MKRGFPALLALVIGLAAANPCEAKGETTPIVAPLVKISTDPFLELETYRLWPGRARDASSDAEDETPTMTVFRPQRGQANGTAIVVAPGGGYIGLAANLEGRQVADWFAAHGVTAFLLKYRVGPKARLPIPLYDGSRAVRFARANAASFGIDPGRIGMIGFSAGGHLSAMTAAAVEPGNPADPDPVNRVSSRPDFLVLGYPWLEATAINAKGGSQYCMFARINCRPQDYESYMPLKMVTADMPPTFIYHTISDHLVPMEGSLRFAMALKAKRVPVELHAFANGEHGSGLGNSDPSLSAWPELLEKWLRGLGFLPGNAKQ